MILELIQEKPPDKGFAIASVIISAFAVVFLLTFVVGALSLPTIHEEKTLEIIGYAITWILSSISMVIGILLSIAGGILQVAVVFSWGNAIRTNIQNTEIILKYIEKDIPDEKKAVINSTLNEISQMKLSMWPFWLYIILIIAAISIGRNTLGITGGIILFVCSLVFLGIFLHLLLKTSSSLSKTKVELYRELLGEQWPPYLGIKKRNVFIIIILSVITASMYWLYTLLQITEELSDSINKEQILRFTLLNERTKKQENS